VLLMPLVVVVELVCGDCDGLMDGGGDQSFSSQKVLIVCLDTEPMEECCVLGVMF
jgi:hypothetical protein